MSVLFGTNAVITTIALNKKNGTERNDILRKLKIKIARHLIEFFILVRYWFCLILQISKFKRAFGLFTPGLRACIAQLLDQLVWDLVFTSSSPI